MNPYHSDLGSNDPMTVLAASPDVVRALVAQSGPTAYARAAAPGKWTVAQVLVHLAQVDMAYGLRARMAVTSAPYQVQPFDQDRWMNIEPTPAGEEALAIWEAFRRFNVSFFRGLNDEQWETTFDHPERGPMTVRVIAELMAGHDLHHLAQLRGLLAPAP
jgi:uncharacterized damage-inducible protein DinB